MIPMNGRSLSHCPARLMPIAASGSSSQRVALSPRGTVITAGGPSSPGPKPRYGSSCAGAPGPADQPHLPVRMRLTRISRVMPALAPLIIMPIVALYLFMRFGILLYFFFNAREELEQVCKKSNIPSALYETNSYFEHYHNTKFGFVLGLYSLFVPVILALNHSSHYTCCISRLPH
jgi:hypothetical protein